jgi:hypothetical protein
LLVPAIGEIPEWVNSIRLDQVVGSNSALAAGPKVAIDPEDWKGFCCDDLFEIKKGDRLTKSDMTGGKRLSWERWIRIMAIDSL